AQAGKQQVTLRQLLSHRSGVSAISEPMAPEQLFDWQAMTAAIAAQEPWWEPGCRHGYAPLTYAWLLGEPLRRLSGQMPGDYLRALLLLPKGMVCHVGLRNADLPRISHLSQLRNQSGDEYARAPLASKEIAAGL